LCIIAYKPKTIKMPKPSILKNCFESNPNGAGYMYRRNNEIHIRKGFMKFDEFYTDLMANVTNKDDVVMHFRIATHSVISPKNTHPFPITSKRSELHELFFDCKRAIVHNGILHDFVDTNDDISDSAFFAKMLYPCQRESQYKAVLDHHNKTSKFVVMTSKFTIVSGQFTKKWGCYFSNYGYEDRVQYTSYYQGCTTWQNGCGAGVVTLPSGHSFDTKAKIYDDEFDKDIDWEKLYGVDGAAVRQYGNGKNQRRGSSSTYAERETERREKLYANDKHSKHMAQFRREKSTVPSKKPLKIDVKTVDGKTVTIDTYVAKDIKTDGENSTSVDAPTYYLPDSLNVNGMPLSFSTGTPDAIKKDVIRKMCQEHEKKKEGFDDYLKRGDAVLDDKYVDVTKRFTMKSSTGALLNVGELTGKRFYTLMNSVDWTLYFDGFIVTNTDMTKFYVSGNKDDNTPVKIKMACPDNGRKPIGKDKYPSMTLRSPDGNSMLFVHDHFKKERFIEMINGGYIIEIGGKTIGDRSEIIVIDNAKKIVGEGRVVVCTSKSTVKLYEGGCDGNVVVSIIPDRMPTDDQERTILKESSNVDKFLEFTRRNNTTVNGGISVYHVDMDGNCKDVTPSTGFSKAIDLTVDATPEEKEMEQELIEELKDAAVGVSIDKEALYEDAADVKETSVDGTTVFTDNEEEEIKDTVEEINDASGILGGDL